MARDHGYTKIPNSFLRFFTRAPITPQHTMMLLAAIRNCHGFHKPDRIFDLKTLGRWLGWDRRRLSQTARELIERGCFCPHGADKNSPKYRIQNDCKKWNHAWKRRTVDKSVDNPVEKPLLTTLFADSCPHHADTLSAPCGQQGELSTAALPAQEKANDAIEKAFSVVNQNNVEDMLEFLKKSLKKSLKKAEDPDLKKRKIQIFTEMTRSGIWSDDEVLDLARTLTVEELEALYARRVKVSGY